jgi:hypothetical protein
MSGEAEPAPGTQRDGVAAQDRRAFGTNVAHSARVHDYWLGSRFF